MRALVTRSVKARVAMVALATGLIIFGIVNLSNLKVDTLPEFSRTTVEVQTEALGLSAAEVEQLITVPLEQNLLNGVAFLDEIDSASLPGLSSVVMTFEPGTDFLTARQVVAERLSQAPGMAGLVQVAKPPQMLQPRSSTSRVAMIRLSSPDQSLIEQSVLARWVIVPRLLGVEGVANVAIWGFRDRQLQVTVDPEVLRDAGVTLDQIVRTTGNALEVSPLSYLEASTPGTGGWIETVNQRLHVFHEQTISTPEELERVPLDGAPSSSPLTLGDVSDVVEDHQPLVGDAYCSPPEDECLLLVVEAFPDANTVEVADGLDETLATMRPGLGNIEVDTSIYRPAEYIRSGFTNLVRALSIAATLLLVALFVFLRRWQSVLAVMATVLLSAVAALVVLYGFDVTINLMIVGGLVLGLVVTVADSVVGVARVASPYAGASADEASLIGSTVEIRGTLLYASLVGVVGLGAVAFLTGPERVFFQPIAASYLLVVGISVLVALTFTPALGALLLSRDPDGLPASPERHGVYRRVAGPMLDRWPTALIAGAVVLAAGLVALPFIRASLRPELLEGDLLVHIAAEPGTSLQRMDEIMAASVSEISALPGVRNVGAHVGRAVASDQVVNVNSGEIWVNLEPNAPRAATITSIKASVDGLSETTSEVLTYSQERIRDALPESQPDTVVVRVYGESAEVLDDTSEEVRLAIGNVDGVVDTGVVTPSEEQTIEVEVNLESAQQQGVSPGDVRRAAATLLSGITVGNLFDEQKVFDVVVWGKPEIRQSEDDVRGLLIENGGGELIALEEVADVRLVARPSVLRRHSVQPYRDVVVEVDEPDATLPAVAAAVQRVDFPLEYHAEVLSTARASTTGQEVLAIMVAAALGVFLLLQAAFSSWRLALLTFVVLGMAVAGGISAILVAGGTVTLGSLAGLVGVLAIAAATAVPLIRRYQDRLSAGDEFGPDLVLEATAERVSAMIGSTIAAAALVAPLLAMGIGSSVGLEVLGPMAVALIGGLLVSAAVNILVLPALYLRFGNVPEPDTTARDLEGAPVGAGGLR